MAARPRTPARTPASRVPSHSLPPGLPGVLADIARAASPEAAEIVARAWGGRRKFVPLLPSRDHELSRLVGHAAALAIGQAIGGGEVKVPSAKSWLHHIDARRLCDQSLSIPRIARRLGLSDNHVREILKGYGERHVGRPPRRPPPADCELCRPARLLAERVGLSDRWVFQLQVNAARVPGTPRLPAPDACPDCGAPFRDPPRRPPGRRPRRAEAGSGSGAGPVAEPAPVQPLLPGIVGPG